MTRSNTLTDTQLRAAELKARRLRSEAVRGAGAAFAAWIRGLVASGDGAKGGRTA